MLSHPILADLIELEFVPCLVNNRGDRGGLGENDATLELFGEPRLNNPVVRFVDAEGRGLAPRLSGRWTPEAVFQGAAAALAAVSRPLPAWATTMAAAPSLSAAVFTCG